MALALLPSKLEIKGSVISYNAQQIMRQCGFDQGVIMIAGKMSFSTLRFIKRNLSMKDARKCYHFLKHYFGEEGNFII